MGTTKTLLFAYEPEQVEAIAAYAREHSAQIVAMDFWVERLFEKRGLNFVSAGDYLPSSAEQDALFEKAQTIAREWYRIPEMAFFEHNGIRIAEAMEVNFDDYVQYVLHHLHIVKKILDRYPAGAHVVVPYSTKRLAPVTPKLIPFQLNSIIDIVMFLARTKGFEVTMIGDPVTPSPVRIFPPERLWHRILIGLYNPLTKLLPRKPIKIFACEYWSHIGPFIEKMDDVELTMIDKSEMRNIPVSQLFRHRVRFLNPQNVASERARRIAKKGQEEIRKQWIGARTHVSTLPFFLYGGVSWWPVVENAFDAVVETYAERVIFDIEGIEEILRRERIGLVLLRASVSAQHHFFVTAHVARRLGIPSVEIQHAGAVLDPRSIHSRLEASYLAAFGPRTCAEYAKRYDEQRLRPIGAPRFDHYFSVAPPYGEEREHRVREIGLDPAQPIVLINVPKDGSPMTLAPWHPTSYDVAAFFEALAASEELPDIQFFLKFRKNACAEHHRRLLRELFPKGNFAISDGDLFSAMTICDYVMSGNSTALYEAIIAGKPLILYPWKPDVYHSTLYGGIGPIAYTPDEMLAELKKIVTDAEYRGVCLNRQQTFIDANYRFDGHASERMAALLKEPLLPLP